MRNEFDNLYRSLFANPDRYEIIVEALASTWKGLSRPELLTITKLQDGGGITTILKELEQSGFISSYVPFNKKKKLVFSKSLHRQLYRSHLLGLLIYTQELHSPD